jgi:outer membrane protein insertion porin family/translocation and assembly module TamA
VTRPRAAAALLALAGGLGTARAAGAQDLACERGDREVRALRFAGNRAFGDAELASVVVTTPSDLVSRLRVLGTRRCLNPDEFARDVLRLAAYYRKRGYPDAAVDTVVRPLGRGGANPPVAVTFAVREGAPVRLDSVTVLGLDSVRSARRVRAAVPLRPGDVFDRAALEAAHDSVAQRLRDSGYPDADALFSWSTDLRRRAATATITAVPGRFARIGRVEVERDGTRGRGPVVPERVVRRTSGLRRGDPVRAGDLLAAQRALYQTDAFSRVDVRLDTAGGPDSLATVRLRVTEGDLRAARASAGWATLECFRLQADYTDRYFLPRAQRLELTGRLARLGQGYPARVAGGGVCSGTSRRDIYGDTVNYYLGATVRQPSFFRLRRVPSVTVFTSRASEYNAYQRVTPVGVLFSLASRPGSRLPSTATYQLERGRTTADPAIFCAVFSACEEATREPLARNRAVGTLGYALARNRADDPLNPQRGSVQRVTLRHSSGFTGSERTQRFNRVVFDASWYFPLGGGGTLTAHAQGGAVFGDAPQQERLFAGGPTTVRGFRQNELGPQVYLVQGFDTVAFGPRTVYVVPPSGGARAVQRSIPAGGNALLVGNLEAQVRSPVLPDLFGLALFTDAGQVWNRGARAGGGLRGLRFTPGAGVRVRSPFGAIRVDLGYNPYAAPVGSALFITQGDPASRVLYCVSPGNALAVSDPGDGTSPTQAGGRCPATYRPPSSRGFLRRLNPSIWIGQAF